MRERDMRRHYFLTPIALLLFHSLAFADNIAPTGTLRAAYLSSNPAQAVRDPTTGEIRGTSADLARELARRRKVPVALIPLPNPRR
jgi:polar amino acid transport system substrate-binding protein